VKYYVTPLVHDYSDIDLYAVVLIKYLGYLEGCYKYAQRWRQIAASVQPPMSEREMADMFMNTLQGNYIERLAACPSISFAEIVIAGERIESLLKMAEFKTTMLPTHQFPRNRLLVTVSEEEKV